MARPKKSKAAKAKTAKTTKAKAPKPVDKELKGKKKGDDAPDTGPLSGTAHNVTAVRKLVVPFAERYNRLLDDKASEAASFMAHVRVLIEDAANDLGCKKSVVREALQRNRRIHKDAEKDAERDREQLDQRDTIEDALGHFTDTPLGAAAVSREKAEKPKDAQASPKAAAAKKATNGSGKVVQMPEPKAAAEGEDEGGDDEQDELKEHPAAA